MPVACVVTVREGRGSFSLFVNTQIATVSSKIFWAVTAITLNLFVYFKLIIMLLRICPKEVI